MIKDVHVLFWHLFGRELEFRVPMEENLQGRGSPLTHTKEVL
jgi:hypothetical protein